MDKIDKFENGTDDLVKKVLAQTDYTEEKALAKLQEFNYDLMRVLKDYMGIPEKKTDTKIKSINQEIYKQLRSRLNSNMKDYQSRVEKGEVKKIV